MAPSQRPPPHLDRLWGILRPSDPTYQALNLFKARPIATIGRDPVNDLVLESHEISECFLARAPEKRVILNRFLGRWHFQLAYAHGQDGGPSVLILDLSTNGTYVCFPSLERVELD